MAKAIVSKKSTPATDSKPQGKIIDVPVTVAELHRGLDMILEAGGPVAKAIGDIVGNALFVIKTRNEARQISFAEAIWELLDESPSPEPDTIKPDSSGAEAPVFVQDAWYRAFDLARGIVDLLSVGTCSSEDFDTQGVIALHSIGDQLVDDMKIVNGYFNPKEEEGKLGR